MTNHSLAEALKKHPASLIVDAQGLVHAAVSVCLRYRNGVIEVLFMQRATRADDSWSGQICFPGGRCEVEDASSKATAERETFEEVGINLNNAEFLGRSDDILAPVITDKTTADQKSLHVAVYVYFLSNEVITRLNYEVAGTKWVSTTELACKNNFREFSHPSILEQGVVGIALQQMNLKNDAVLWGLSLAILTQLFTKLQLPLAASLSNATD